MPSPANPKDTLLQVRVGRAEKRRMRKAARLAHVPAVSTWARMVLNREVDRVLGGGSAA